MPVANSIESTADPVRLADFLVIGAMKAGTTSLFHDLRSQAGIFLPDKESDALLEPDSGLAFSKLFAGCGTPSLCGEVCPDYTKFGEGEKAAQEAKLCYADARPPKLVYLVREPIARLRSHHYFLSSQHGDANPGGMTGDIEASLRDFPELIETSRYHARLQPWIDAFGREAVMVVRFEDYISDRVGVLKKIVDFIGLKTFSKRSVDSAQVHNPSASRPVATPFWRRIMHHPLYRRLIRPWLSLRWRDRLRSVLLPSPPPRPAPPSLAALQRLVDEFRPEVVAISKIAAQDGSEFPLWDLDAAAETARH